MSHTHSINATSFHVYVHTQFLKNHIRKHNQENSLGNCNT